MPKVASRAGLWYNGSIKMLTSAMLETSARLRQTLLGGSSMDTLSPLANDGNIPQKHCTGPCGRDLPATPEFFNRNKACFDGLHTQCKQCRSKKNKANYSKPEVRERVIARARVYRAQPGMQEYRSEQYKQWRTRPDVREHITEYNKSYREVYYSQPENKARKQAIAKEYGQRPEVREHRRPMERVYSSHRRAMKKAVGGSYTNQQIQEQLKRQKYCCYYAACGQAKFEKRNGKYIYHIDHTFPLNRVVGTDIPANDISYLVLTCPHCNATKNDKFPWEWPEGGRLL